MATFAERNPTVHRYIENSGAKLNILDTMDRLLAIMPSEAESILRKKCEWIADDINFKAPELFPGCCARGWLLLDQTLGSLVEGGKIESDTVAQIRHILS